MQKEIIVFQTNDLPKLEVVYENETVWLTQAQMAELFGTTRNNISLHISKILKENGQNPDSVCKYFLLTAKDGKAYKTKIYNFDIVNSVGFRVNFSVATQFKNWAEDAIKSRTSNMMISDNSIGNLIKIIRNQQVMLDSDLAVLYGVETKRLIEQVTRNIERFPEDFMFQLTWEECGNLKSQIATSSSRSQFATLNVKKGENIKYLPYAFTEQGVAMLSSVLHSPTAIEANIRIMRAFVGMRHFINENVTATIYTARISHQFQLDLERHNSQYQPITVNTFNRSHDRFLIINDEVYHIGASLKDLGKKWFSFSILNFSKEEIVGRLA